MPRILILTASYGSGHNVAAQSLAAAFARAGAEVTVVDHFRDLVHPAFDRVSRACYAWILRRTPAVWGVGYALGDWMSSDSRLALGVTRLGARGLARLLGAHAPDVVVTVHATPTVAMSWLAGRGVRVPPHTTVVTDFVAHSQWIAPRVDRYCVAAEEVKHEFIARGIPPERIVVTGMPVREEFDAPVDALAARAAFGLSPGKPVVLAMAGARGAFGRLRDVAHALARLPRSLQGVIVNGREPNVRVGVRHLDRDSTMLTLGYVADIRRLMGAADLLVTKAGGMTLAEAIAAELPLVVYGSLPGQERRNQRFASRSGIALVVRSRRELARVLDHALGDPALLDHLRARIARLRRPGASGRIVEVVLDLCASRR